MYEVDRLEYPQCGGAMKIISFIERRRRDVIERVLRHCGLWEGRIRTLANRKSCRLPWRALGSLAVCEFGL